MRLKKTARMHLVPCGNDNYVIYNTLLNRPLVINQESRCFLDKIQYVGQEQSDYSEDEVALIEALHESYILIEEDKDEYSICKSINDNYLNQVADGQSITLLDLRISEACNFGCRHCISAKSRKNGVMKAETALSVIDHIVDFLSEKQSDFCKLDLHYGNAEPLLNFSVIQSIQNHLKKEYSHLTKSISINTNLSLLTKEMALFFRDEDIAIYASLDGQKTANDAIRITKNGKCTFDIIMSKIKMLAELGNPLRGISVTLTNLNFPLFDKSFVDWCKDQGFKSLAIDFDLVNPLNIGVTERVDFLATTWERCNNLGIDFFGTWITPFLNLSNRSLLNKHYGFCKGIHGQSLSVAPDGMIYICGSSSTPICNYRELNSAIQNNGKMYNLIKSRLVSNNEFCKGCVIEGACAGQCHVTHEYTEEKMREQCAYFIALTEKLLEIQGANDRL